MKGNRLERPRMAEMLEEALQNPAVVLYAGMGFGKTTAVIQYQQCCREQKRLKKWGSEDFVWISLSEGDDEPKLFWEKFLQVLRTAGKLPDSRARNLPFPEDSEDIHRFFILLERELRKREQPVQFVVDAGTREIPPKQWSFIHQWMTARLMNCKILLLTRCWPIYPHLYKASPVLLSRDALRFTQRETRALFEVYGVELPEESLNCLHRFLGGWPAAVDLAARSLLREKNSPELVTEHPRVPNRDLRFFQESEQETQKALRILNGEPILNLFALFEEAVLSEYSKEEQKLLFALSCMESFPVYALKEIAGIEGQRLHLLIHENPLIAYDASRQRIRFRGLCRASLQARWISPPGEEECSMLRRVALCCRTTGNLEDAFYCYFFAGDIRQSWKMLERISVRCPREQIQQMVALILLLPENFRQENPVTNLVLSSLLGRENHPARALQFLERAKAGFRQEEEENDENAFANLGECSAVEGMLSLILGREDYLACFREAERRLPTGSRYWSGNLVFTEKWLGLQIRTPEPGGLKAAMDRIIDSVPYIKKLYHGSGSGLEHFIKGEACYLTNHLKEAEQEAFEAIYHARAQKQGDVQGRALLLLFRIRRINGRYEELLELLSEMNRPELKQAPFIWGFAKQLFQVLVGDTEEASQWVADQMGGLPAESHYIILLQARQAIMAQQENRALAMISGSWEEWTQKRQVLPRIYGSLYRCAAYSRMGDYETARTHFEIACRLAYGNRLIMPFVESGDLTRRFLEHEGSLRVDGIDEDWIAELRSKAITNAKRHTGLVGKYRAEHGEEEQCPTVNLSGKEQMLLQDISQGLTRKEIADGMGLGMNTVKSMLRQIYDKLGAVNSADAVRIAMQRKIL